jgi:asparagine synthase (glutamine-hydrolysing)
VCGIAGVWHFNGESLSMEKLVRFTDSIQERGPDGSGYELFENGTLGLGHRRLSILDLSEAGKQPMSYLEGRYHITYNGEVFNFSDLKKELEQKGYSFRSDTDTEIILAAYDAWGIDCLNRFNGMWAFAIWDSREKQLFMARDRFGIKPFYYSLQPGKMLAFASETRAFKKLTGYTRNLDEKMVKLQADGARIHGSGYTIFKDIYSILPGHYAIVKKDGVLAQKRWWNIENHLWNSVPKTLEEQAEQYYELFEDACKIRLVSDVKVATALSGGLDSSSVYSVVNRLLKKGNLNRVPEDSQKAVVVTFPGLENDERAFAEKAIEYTGGDALFLPQVYPNLAEQITKDTIMFDGLNPSPITAISGLYRGMRQNGVTVSLDGHGVDEMLYGYRDMLYNLFQHYYKTRDLQNADMVRNVIIPTCPDHDQQRVLANLNMLMKQARSPLSGLKAIAKKLLGRQGFDRTEYSNSSVLKPIGEQYDFAQLGYPDRVVFNETFIETLPDIFRNFDLAGMMNSVEIRMPFMDWRLVTYQFSLPIQSKIGKGYNKLVLRESMKGRMAEEIRLRRLKIGISSPVAQWFRDELKDWTLDIIHSQIFLNNFGNNANDLRTELVKSYDNNDGPNEQLARKVWQAINLHLIV